MTTRFPIRFFGRSEVLAPRDCNISCMKMGGRLLEEWIKDPFAIRFGTFRDLITQKFIIQCRA
jgi:hypothetical protein